MEGQAMCPLCDLLGLGIVALVLGPGAVGMLMRHVPRGLARLLPLSFVGGVTNDAHGGWQSLPPLPIPAMPPLG